jgi:hypothetical protein
MQKKSPYFCAVKQSKKTRNLPIGQDKNKLNNWKKKAITRRKEIERLRKRVKELTGSREGWKKEVSI